MVRDGLQPPAKRLPAAPARISSARLALHAECKSRRMSRAPDADVSAVDPSAVDAFIARWQHASGSELANAQLFVSELARLLDLPQPDPAREETSENAYVFERRVRFRHGDGSASEGRIDCYRRGAFVLEAKRLRQAAATRGFDDAMLRARAQAESYARALPADEGRPPFLLVVDVGHAIEFYSEFTRSGATYTPFPDPRSHRIRLADLRDEAIRQRLAAVWRDPLALDPSRHAARVTRDRRPPCRAGQAARRSGPRR